MHVYDRYLFPRGSLARRAAKRGIRIVRQLAPGLADRLAPLRRRLLSRLYEESEAPQVSAAALVETPRASEPAGGEAARRSAETGTGHGANRAPRSTAIAVASSAGAPSVDPSSLRVMHLIGSLQAGGAERQVLYTLEGLRRRGYRLAELMVTEGLRGSLGHYRAAIERAGVPVSVAGDRFDPSFESELAARPGLAERLRAIPFVLRPRVSDLAGELLVRRPHVLHCWLDHTNLWGGAAAAIVGVPRIILSTRNVSPMHMPHLREPWFEEWYRALAAMPNVLLVNNSKAGAEDYAKWLDIPLERFRVILNGVDFSHVERPSLEVRAAFRAELGIPAAVPLVTGVFRMADEKQPQVFVRVAERVLDRAPNAQVLLAGAGRLEREIRRSMKRSRHAKRMHHLGRREDVPTILAESRVVLLTSKAEGTPNVLLEAQHLGCPPVTTAAGGAGDAIDPGATGFVRPIGDEAGIVEAVLRLLDDSALHASMAAAGPRWVRSRFGLERMIDETIDLYRGL